MSKVLRALMLIFLVAGGVEVRAADYTIKFSHVVAENTPKGRAALLFSELLAKRTNGRVKVEVFPNSQLYDDDKVLEAMRLSDSKTTGIIAAPSLSKFVKFSNTLQAFDLPYLFASVDDVHTLVDSPVMAKMTAGLEAKGLHALTVWDNGMKVFSIKGDKPLRNIPADFTGKKFRIQSSNISAAMIETLGGIPQKLSFKEVYTALGQGVVDGQENTWSNINSKKFHEVQSYISVSNHSYLGYLMVVSSEFWKKLPADIRSAITDALREATEANRKYAAEADNEDRQKVAAAGFAKVVELTDAERKVWRDATVPVWSMFRDEIGGELIDEINGLLKH